MKDKEMLPCYQKRGQKVNIHFGLFLLKNMKGFLSQFPIKLRQGNVKDLTWKIGADRQA